MPAVADLTALYGNFMLNPRPGAGVCRTCFNLIERFDRCYACAHQESWLDAVAPISYSVSGGQLHHALAQYKRQHGTAARRLELGLAAVVWRFLEAHERCVADAAGVEQFEVVTTVPSGERLRDDLHPLRRVVGDLVAPTRTRYERALFRSATHVDEHTFHPGKYEPAGKLSGEAVLLLDDTWTTGANAQSAAAALRRAGAAAVAVVAIGRHINPEWGSNAHRLGAIPQPFDWERCALGGD